MILFVARGVQEGVLGQLEFPEESRVIGGSEVELVVFFLRSPFPIPPRRSGGRPERQCCGDGMALTPLLAGRSVPSESVSRQLRCEAVSYTGPKELIPSPEPADCFRNSLPASRTCVPCVDPPVNAEGRWDFFVLIPLLDEDTDVCKHVVLEDDSLGCFFLWRTETVTPLPSHFVKITVTW